eukprot:12150230-Ditylum_brightwellii.AAC.1
MPPYHIHYREEMQKVVKYVLDAYNTTHPTFLLEKVKHAENCYRGSMRGLHGHVQIEEYACFPLYQRVFPEVDIAFLWEDHEELHTSEEKVYDAFRKVTSSDDDSVVSREELMVLMKVIVDFDDQLMTHLGEEEEVVVPMSLTEKQIWF